MADPPLLDEQIRANRRKTWLIVALVLGLLFLVVFTAGYLLGLGAFAFLFAFAAAFAYFGIAASAGVPAILKAAKARPADPRNREEKVLQYRVEELAIASGLPVPKVYVQESRDINAFAAGKHPGEAVVCVTTGAMEQLNDEEMEGVLAHEMSHVKNHDVRLATYTLALVGLIALLAEIIFRVMLYGGFRGGGRGKGGGVAIAVLLVVGLVALILAPLLSRLAYFAMSRRREYLADASGAYMTRNPEGLANALEKIYHDVPDDPKGSPTVAALYISNPWKRALRESVWSTHPPLANRIRRLRPGWSPEQRPSRQAPAARVAG